MVKNRAGKTAIATGLLIAIMTITARGDDAPVRNEVFKFCISSYRDGDYQKTIECINEMLPRFSGLTDSLEAFKYLGLSYGMQSRIEQSKNCFRMLLEKAPGAPLDTLELPPNISLIYNQVVLEKRLEKISAQSETLPARPGPRQSKSVMVPAMLLGAGLTAAGVGGWFIYKGYDLNRQYHNLPPATTPEKFQDIWGRSQLAYVEGAAFSVAGAALITVALYLHLHKETKVGLRAGSDRVDLVVVF